MDNTGYIKEKEKMDAIMQNQKARKVRIGMVYAGFGAPMLGIAFGFAGMAGGLKPFSNAFPTGSLCFQMFEMLFGLLAIFIYSCTIGSVKEHFRVFRSKIACWGVFTAMTGMIGDFLYFAASAIVGGSIAGPLAATFGFWGAVITAIVWREKLLTKWTIIGVVFILIGVWVASGGLTMAAPAGVSNTTVIIGAIMGLLAAIIYGAENFAICAGSDFMPEETTLFWRAGWAIIGSLCINFFIMPQFSSIASEMISNPMWYAYGGITGGAWGVYMITSYYIGINTAGTSGGGVLSATGFVWATLLSMFVYNSTFSPMILIGTLVMFVGIAIMLVRPEKVVATLRE